MVAIVENQALGETRISFLRPVNRIGNRISAGRGRKVVERFADDPQLGTEANRILKGRGRNDCVRCQRSAAVPGHQVWAGTVSP